MPILNIFVFRFVWKSYKKWYFDSGYSRHMIGNQSKFVNLYKKDSGLVTFADNKKGKIIDKDTIANDTCTFIENVLLVMV